jgi:hypothetical protein
MQRATSMSIHLPDFLRKAPVESVRRLLHAAATESFAEVDWKQPRQDLCAELNDIIRNLDERRRDRLYADFDRIGQFTNEYGRRSLREVLSAYPQVLDEYDNLQDITACAVFVLDFDGDAFEKALSANFAQRLLNGRDWTGFDFEPGIELKVGGAGSTNEFERRLSEIFDEDGPKSRVAVERFTLGGTHESGAREQFTIFAEAPPETALEFGDAAGRVEARTIRPVREGAIVFDPVERTLDVVGKNAGKARRRQIAEAFADMVLVSGAELSIRTRRNLSLDRLKSKRTFDIRPEDHVRSIEVTRLSLRGPDASTIVTVETSSSRDGKDFYERAESALGPYGPLARDTWPVLSAKLKIVFEPERPKARAKSVTFELRSPDRTNLRDQIEYHRVIADKLLSRWGLYSATP